MKQVLKILSFLILLVVLTSEDCSNSHRTPSVEVQKMDVFDKIESAFEKDELTIEDLQAYEQRSEQMLEDLIDYVNIYSDSSISNEFRKQVKQMIYELFISEAEVDSFFLRLNAAEDKENNLLLFPNNKAVKLVLGSKSIAKKLGAYKFGNYAGSIEYNLTSTISEDLNVKDQFNIILKKSEKRFGIESVLIWEVFFSAQR